MFRPQSNPLATLPEGFPDLALTEGLLAIEAPRGITSAVLGGLAAVLLKQGLGARGSGLGIMDALDDRDVIDTHFVHPVHIVHIVHGPATELPCSKLGTRNSELVFPEPRAPSPEPRLYCVDAANCFDPYIFAQHARRAGLDPEEILDRVFVTRTFTIHQLQAVVAEMLPVVARQTPAPALAVLGLDDLFREESLPVSERANVLREVVGQLRVLPPAARVLVTYTAPPPNEAWWKPLLGLGGRGSGLRKFMDGMDIMDARNLELVFPEPRAPIPEPLSSSLVTRHS